MISSIDAMSRNVGYALRVLARTPGLTLTVILTLALGIGASSAVFTAVDAVLLEPLPFPDADRLVSVRQTRERATVANVAPVRLEEWNERNSTFEALMGYTTQNAADASAEIPESIRVAGVSRRMLDVWGIEPILGRGFVAADHEANAAPVAMIAESLWQRRFNRDPGVLGKIISSGDQTAEIVGVMPATFAFPDPDVEVWGATTYQPFVLNRYNAWFTSFGRLKPGVTVEQAQADLRRIQAQLAEAFPETDREVGVDVVSLQATTVGSVRASLWLLFGAVSVLLLIACTNIAALLLARAAERQPQFAVRLALGASKASVHRQMLAETAILAVVGAVLGLLVANGFTFGFRALAPNFPRLDDITLSGTTLAFTATLVVAVTFLCGLAPAMQNARETSARIVLEADRSQISRRHSLHWTFVGVQVALSVALLAGAGLLMRSFQELSRVDTGFDPTNVLTFRITGSFAERFAEPRPERRAHARGAGCAAWRRRYSGVVARARRARRRIGFSIRRHGVGARGRRRSRCTSHRPSPASSRRRTSRRWPFPCSSARRAAGQRATAFRRSSSIKRSPPDTCPAGRPSGWWCERSTAETRHESSASRGTRAITGSIASPSRPYTAAPRPSRIRLWRFSCARRTTR